MKNIVAVLIFWMGSILAGLTFQTQAQDDCSNLLSPNYYYSGEGYVLSTVTTRVNIRAQPSPDAAILGELHAGDRFIVLAEQPTCSAGYYWVNVNSNGIVGWAAESYEQEYWLAPYMVHEFYGYGAGMEQIHFSYPPQVGENTDAVLYPANAVDVVPEYAQISFQSFSYAEDTYGWYNNGANVFVYPTVTMMPGGFMDFSAARDDLQALLDAQAPTVALNAFPMLPMVNVPQILVEQMAYLNFQNGRGVRALVAASFAVDPITPKNLYYTYQGLSNDGAYYVSVMIPVRADFLPAVDDSFYTQDAAQIDAYYADVRAQLAGALPGQFLPNLSDLDTMIASFLLESPLATVVVPAGGTAQLNYGGLSLIADSNLVSRMEVRQTPAYIEEEAGMSMYGSTPGSTTINFFGWPASDNVWNAQIRIFPVSEYEPGSIYDTMRKTFSDFLMARAPLTPVFDGVSMGAQTLPIAEPVNAAQVFAVQPAYMDFQNGSGYRFVGMYSQAPMPVTNGYLTYYYSGITADGKYVVFATFPVQVSILSEDFDMSIYDNVDYEQVTQQIMAQNLVDIEALQALSPDDFTPSLAQIDAMMTWLLVQ